MALCPPCPAKREKRVRWWEMWRRRLGPLLLRPRSSSNSYQQQYHHLLPNPDEVTQRLPLSCAFRRTPRQHRWISACHFGSDKRGRTESMCGIIIRVINIFSLVIPALTLWSLRNRNGVSLRQKMLVTCRWLIQLIKENGFPPFFFIYLCAYVFYYLKNLGKLKIESQIWHCWQDLSRLIFFFLQLIWRNCHVCLSCSSVIDISVVPWCLWIPYFARRNLLLWIYSGSSHLKR